MKTLFEQRELLEKELKQFDPLYKDLQGNDPDFHLRMLNETPEVFEEEENDG